MEIISNAQCFRDPLGDLRINDGPLSLCNDLGWPNLWMISWSNFFLPPPQSSLSRWESLQSILWMYLSWLIGVYTLEKLASGWSPSANPLLAVPCHWTGWASCSLQAPWGLFNWQVGQEETTCLLVIWRPVPLKDLSSNIWRAFSPKWVVACKELTNFHWRFPGRKRSPSFWNHPILSSWKPSLLALRVSSSVYEGVSGKLVCWTNDLIGNPY